MRTLAALILTAALGLLTAALPAAADPLVAEVRVNGGAAGTVAFERDGDRLTADPEALKTLRLKPPAFRTDVELGDIPGVRYRIDERAQLVDITADLDAIASTRLAVRRPPAPAPATPAWGAALNYTVFTQKAGLARAQASAIGDLRVFGPYGVLTQSGLVRHGSAGMPDGVQRLETTYTIEDYRHARRLLIGDYVSAGNAWSSPVRAAGVRLTTDLTLRPDLAVQPLAQIRGAAATASAVDLYIDGVQRLRSQAPSGPFTVDVEPMIDGRGRIDLVVTDALGRRTAQRLPFYASGDLLAPGRLDYSIEAGRLREDFAAASDRYTDAYGAVSARRGMNGYLTLEGRVAARRGLQTAGVELTAKLGEEALMTVAFNASHGAAGDGPRLYAGIRRDTRLYSLYAVYDRSDGNYRELADPDGLWRTHSAVQLGAAWRTDRWGDFALSYNRLERRNARFGLAGANWSKGYGRFNLYASLLSDDGGSTRASLGMTVPLGVGRSTSAAVTYGGREGTRWTGAASATPEDPTGWGWRVAGEAAGAGRRNGSRLEGEVRRLTNFGEVGGGLANYGGSPAAQAYASGSVIWLAGGRPVAAARLGESFAVVDTGRPGVEVLVENRPAGRTGRDGRLLAAQLSSSAASRIALRPETVSLDDDITVQSQMVRPPRGAGLWVRMPVVRTRSVLVKLVDPAGRPLPVGLRATVDGAPSGLVGFDGLAYLAGLTPRSLVEIIADAGRCRLEVPHDATAPPGAPLGPLVCRLDPDGALDPGMLADNGEGGELHRQHRSGVDP